MNRQAASGMQTKMSRRTLTLGSLLGVGGCATGFVDPTPGAYPRQACATDRSTSADLGVLTYRAVDQMICLAPQMSPSTPVIVSSITDSQRLDQSSRFGTLVADLVKSRLARNNVIVSEQRLRTRMLLRRDDGEMMLSRDMRAMVPSPPYACVVTGTYAAADTRVYVALKLIDASDARIMSAVDFVVWRNSDVSRLLGEGAPA